tara:strand:- start:17365 stop:17493 length:129 start_codon:yes stop_codon:yes gene_type:complete
MHYSVGAGAAGAADPVDPGGGGGLPNCADAGREPSIISVGAM